MQTCFHGVHGLAALVVHFTWTWASYVCQCRNTSVSYRLNSAFFKTLVVLELFVFSTGSMQPCFIQVHGLAALVVWFILMHESQVSCIDSDSNYFHESQWLRIWWKRRGVLPLGLFHPRAGDR